jgi:hypothetical protein
MHADDKLEFTLQVCPATSLCASHHHHLSVIHTTKLGSAEALIEVNRSAIYLRERCLGIGAPVCNDFRTKDKYNQGVSKPTPSDPGT